MADAQYTQYYVAFLDILGFKNLVDTPGTTCHDILKIYEAIEDVHKEFNADDKYEKANIKMKIMSDSVCAYVAADIPNALFSLVAHCALFQLSLLAMVPSIFVRGGITFGDMYVKEDIIFGPALTEAYLLEERNSRVPRIIIRKGTLDHGASRSDKPTQKRLRHWVTRDDDAFYIVNHFNFFNTSSRDEYLGILEQVKSTVSNWLDTTIDESIRQKYLYVEKQMRKYIKEDTDA